jgi:hypothetical protein
MKEKTFIEKAELENKTEIQKIEYLAYYYSGGSAAFDFTINEASGWLEKNGFSSPNKSRLLGKVIKCKEIVKSRKKEYFHLSYKCWNLINKEIDIFNEEKELEDKQSIIPEELYISSRTYVKLLAKQINASYENIIFDGCAVLMRRLLEILLIHSYEKLNIQNKIQNTDGSYKMLVDIVNSAKTDTVLSLSRNTKECLDDFRDIGNFAAHKIFYNTKKCDIDKIRINYRASIEELLYKSGLRS